jgi:hypothetical protein
VRFAKSAGHAAVAEKQGLLPPRPSIGGAWENGACGSDIRLIRPQDRRPADVFLLAWDGGRPAAINLAVTSGLQSALVDLSAADGAAAAERYADRKRRYLDTAEQCADAGLAFKPFILEAEGGLGRDARALLTGLGHDSGRMTGEAPSVRAELAVQALSVALHRENARAIVRRAVGTALLAAPLAAARQQLQSAAAAVITTDIPLSAPVLTVAAAVVNPTNLAAVSTLALDPASSRTLSASPCSTPSRAPCPCSSPPPPLCTPAPTRGPSHRSPTPSRSPPPAVTSSSPPLAAALV